MRVRVEARAFAARTRLSKSYSDPVTNTRPSRGTGARRLSARRVPLTIDLVLLAFGDGRLQALTIGDPETRGRRLLPWFHYDAVEPIDTAIREAAHEVLGSVPSWLEQVGAYDGRKRHPADGSVSVAFVGLVGDMSEPRAANHAWTDLAAVGTLPPRQRAMVDDALVMLRERIDFEPLAFRLLPSAFTLSELQQIYEQILGQSLHKASFRRALQSAQLVQPLNEFRTEGRGRPAQLYRYAPRHRQSSTRSARFDLLEDG
jgi:8-oxo-dGTP diphosphatase